MDYALSMRILMLTGILNLVLMLLLSLSCRCVMGPKVFGRLSRSKKFQKFYSLHCYMWPLLFASTVVHFILALYMFA